MRSLNFTVPQEYDSKQLQSFLRGEVKLSLRLMRSLKRVENGIEINGKHARTVDVIHTGDTVTLNIPYTQGSAKAESDIALDIIYEDNDVLVVNKPAMLPIHESHNHQGDTLANAVAAYLKQSGKSPVFRAIGRLDKGTSGLVVCALNQHSAARLSGNIDKEYLAIPSGYYVGSGTVDAPIYRPDPMKTLRCVDPRGERAVTHYESVKSSPSASLLKIQLETGRTHQIRVHFSNLGTPLVGDFMYGAEDSRIAHQCLHCGFVGFTQPITGERIECSAQMPEDMKIIADSI